MFAEPKLAAAMLATKTDRKSVLRVVIMFSSGLMCGVFPASYCANACTARIIAQIDNGYCHYSRSLWGFLNWTPDLPPNEVIRSRLKKLSHAVSKDDRCPAHIAYRNFCYSRRRQQQEPNQQAECDLSTLHMLHRESKMRLRNDRRRRAKRDHPLAQTFGETGQTCRFALTRYARFGLAQIHRLELDRLGYYETV
jgi:hypothetical protein